MLLQTVQINVRAKPGDEPIRARALIDTGSEHTFVSRRIASQLEAEDVDRRRFSMVVFGEQCVSAAERPKIRIFASNISSGLERSIEGWVVEKVCGPIPRLRSWSQLPEAIRRAGPAMLETESTQLTF